MFSHFKEKMMIKNIVNMAMKKNFNAFYFYDRYIHFSKKINKTIVSTFVLSFLLIILYTFLNLLILEPFEKIGLEHHHFYLLSEKISQPTMKSIFSFYEIIILPICSILSFSALLFSIAVKDKGVWLLNKIIQIDEKFILQNSIVKIDNKQYQFKTNIENNKDNSTQDLSLNSQKELLHYFYPLIIYFYLKEKYRHMAYEHALSYLNFNTITCELEVCHSSADDKTNKIEKIYKKWIKLEKYEQEFIQNCFSCLDLDNILFQCLLNDSYSFYGFAQFEFIYQMNKKQFINDYNAYILQSNQYSMMNIEIVKWLFEHAFEDEKMYQFLKDPKIYYGAQAYHYYHDNIGILDEKVRLSKIIQDPEKDVVKRKNRKI
jgi:hypothetical protein